MSGKISRQSPKIRPVASALDSGDRTALSVMESPSLRPKSKVKKHKSRPQMRKLTLTCSNSKFVYSVDDDVNEDTDSEENNELPKRDKIYLDGYHDALRALYHQKKARMADASGVALPEEDNELRSTPLRRNGPADDVMNDSIVLSDEDHGNGEGDDSDHVDDAVLTHTSSSSETIESLNLKDRQNAINSTHPFGIKIWKPSIYKKNRSVAVRAEEDIHDYDPRRPTGPIFFGVYLTNFLWLCTMGVLLYSLCVLGAALVFVLSGFAWHKHLRPYVKLLLKLGRYWLYPFGKFVLLNKDENYLEEDELDGRSISEFHRWRLEEEGRLFFAPPRRMTTSESRPLIKDHKGRPLREAYETSTSNRPEGDSAIEEGDQLPQEVDDADTGDIKVRFFGRGSWSTGRFLFYIYFYGILQPVSFLIAAFCWLFVFTIPMVNLNQILCEHLRRRPLALHFEKEKEYYKKIGDENTRKLFKSQSIILCTYRCCGWHYYKYTLGGTNIFFINLTLVVALVIIDYFFLKKTLGWNEWYTESSFLFCGCLVSTIPLAYFIGQAVASISAQSSMGVGAVINAFFSTVVEIFLYCVALNQSKGKLVEGSMIGSILAGVLLLPGLSMCGGALNRKTQRYNPRSAGVSSTMLLFAMVSMFAPSLFHQMYGSYEIRCRKCTPSYTQGEDCTTCQFIQPVFSLDNLYYKVLRPFSLLVAVTLAAAYVCGLYFTLKTHASLIWATNSHELQAQQTRKEVSDFRSPSVLSLDNATLTKLKNTAKVDDRGNHRVVITSPVIEQPVKKPAAPGSRTDGQPPSSVKESETQPSAEDENGGHDAPNWSNNVSAVILLVSTLLYAIIAEILVDNVDEVLASIYINPKFLGLTVFALVPNTTEFVNAISFAVGGNVALSMEIGSAYALQVVLIQIPSLVLYSVFKGFNSVEMIFSLIFPRWDVVATLMSVYLFTYVYAEGKSNYFKGVILILVYIVVLTGFYLDDVVADLDMGNNSGFPGLFSLLVSTRIG